MNFPLSEKAWKLIGIQTLRLLLIHLFHLTFDLLSHVILFSQQNMKGSILLPSSLMKKFELGVCAENSQLHSWDRNPDHLDAKTCFSNALLKLLGSC